MDDKLIQRRSRDEIKARCECGQYSSAAKMAELHVDAHPDDGQGWLCLADALEGMGRHSEARRALRIASVTCPRRSRHLLAFRRGHIQKNRCRWGSARRWYELSILLDPSEAAYRVFLGEMLVAMGCLKEAVGVFERASAEAHVGPVEEILFNHGCALRGLGRLQEAEVQFRLALVRCPDHEDALVALEDVAWRG